MNRKKFLIKISVDFVRESDAREYATKAFRRKHCGFEPVVVWTGEAYVVAREFRVMDKDDVMLISEDGREVMDDSGCEDDLKMVPNWVFELPNSKEERYKRLAEDVKHFEKFMSRIEAMEHVALLHGCSAGLVKKVVYGS